LPPIDAASELAVRVARAVEEALDLEISDEQALVRPAGGSRDWDYQSNVAMGLAKRARLESRKVATKVTECLQVEDISDPPTLAGPGFINFRLRTQWIEDRLAEQFADERLGAPTSRRPGIAVIDYSAPNVAKEMHVGHLRSTIIGDALARLLCFCGHEIVPQNHLGDWGTPFGMLIEHMLDEGWSEVTESTYSIGDLNAFYKHARERFDSDPEFRDRSRRRVVVLQAGDEPTHRIWKSLVAESERHFDEVYRLLGVLLDHSHLAPESSYSDRLAEVVDELTRLGLTEESEGATCVFVPGITGRRGEPLPLILRKQDRGYTYDTTDLAAIRSRVRDLHPAKLLYVVGAPQRTHLALVFAVAREAGWITDEMEVRHVAFGSVLGEDGKMLRTRAGTPVRLVDLLRDAIARADALLEQRGELDRQRREKLAQAIGIGAVKYADLATDRVRDYVFSFDRMLSLEGNTSVYLQYANARARSVLARGADMGTAPGSSFRLTERPERELALQLLRLPSALAETLADLRPHKLCNYLFGTAVSFSAFYETCPVLAVSDDDLRATRLALCELTSRVLTIGLELLGIAAPEQL
jgi:arginyl-tRNA synthetase